MRALAKRGPAPGGQPPHRAREGALRGSARSARSDGRRGAAGRVLADDRGDRRLTKDRFRSKDRKSTRLNSSHRTISYAVFCLKKKNSTKKFRPSTIELLC